MKVPPRSGLVNTILDHIEGYQYSPMEIRNGFLLVPSGILDVIRGSVEYSRIGELVNGQVGVKRGLLEALSSLSLKYNSITTQE